MNGGKDTIVAQATAPALGAVGIVRISGSQVKDIAQKLINRFPKPRFASLVQIFDPHSVVIDTGIALFFPGPNSFTGEDVLEVQCHGGLVILDMIVQACVAFGARMARPGEFSERAFLNNKIDLCQAEAIADLITASTELAARSAHRSLSGLFSEKINFLQNALTKLRVYVEASIDFAEEEIDFLSDGTIQLAIENLLTESHALLKNAEKGQLLQEGNKVVIAGKPNVGKSSLFNLLAQNELAIVTDIPGTTRDIIKETVQINGVPIHLMDTAGIREASDQVEAEGIRRARLQFETADRILLLLDATASSPITEIELDILRLYPEKVVLVVNKVDLVQELPHIDFEFIAISIQKEIGIENLYQALTHHMDAGEGVFSARRRHVEALKITQQCINNAKIQLIEFKAGELVAEELKQAQQALSEVTGQISSDELLGKIFSTFCIGK